MVEDIQFRLPVSNSENFQNSIGIMILLWIIIRLNAVLHHTILFRFGSSKILGEGYTKKGVSKM